MPLSVDYRPTKFEDMIGNKSAIESLKSIFNRKKEKIPHSFLVFGETGTGKTTIARIIKEKLGCSNLDYQEINAADKNSRGIESISEKAKMAKYKPLMGNVKVITIDESHQITKDGMNSLLKVLEEPPSHLYFILCTTEPDKIIKAIRTRCLHFETSKLSDVEIKSLIDRTVIAEFGDDNKIKSFPKAIEKIVSNAEGLPRKCLTMLDKIVDIEKEEDMLEALNSDIFMESDNSNVIDLCRILLKSPKWGAVSKILSSIDEDPEKVRRAILSYMSKVLLSSENDTAYGIIACLKDSLFYSGKPGLVSAIYRFLKS